MEVLIGKYGKSTINGGVSLAMFSLAMFQAWPRIQKPKRPEL